LTAESKSRKPSSLKGAMKYFKQGTISLCGGLPSRYVGLLGFSAALLARLLGLVSCSHTRLLGLLWTNCDIVNTFLLKSSVQKYPQRLNSRKPRQQPRARVTPRVSTTPREMARLCSIFRSRSITDNPWAREP
jgi:hypothetical protein